MDELQQSDKEQAVVNLAKAWWRNSKLAADPRRQVVDKCYKYYKGEHITQAQKLKKHGPKSMRNYIFSSVEDAVALLTDNKPAWDTWPRERQDIQIAEKTKQVMDYVWDAAKMDECLPRVIRDHFIAGRGWFKIWFDPDKNYPNGEIVVEAVHPNNVYLDPDATSIDSAKYVIHAVPTPLWLFRKMYPDRGRYVKADDTISMTETEESSTASINATVNQDKGEYSGLPGGKHYRNWLLEIYVRDDAELEEDELNELGETVRQKGGPKYPNGRKIVVGGDVLLEDGPNPFEDGEPPFVELPNYEQTDGTPLGDVEFLIEINADINKIVSRLNDYIRQTAHTYLVYDAEANIDDNSLTNIEAALIKKSGAGEVEVIPPPNFPPAVFEWLSTCKSDLEIISGIREVLQGRDPKAGQSGIAFERLQEFALSRIRKKARNVDSALIRIGEKVLSRVKQFYTNDRQIRITGDFPIIADPQPQIDPMSGMPMMDQMSGQPMMGDPQVAGYRNYDFVEFSNKEFYQPDEAGQMREVNLDVVLAVGSSQAATRLRERQDAAFLLQAGVIDKEELAKRFDVKNYREIQARIQQEQMQMMVMQEKAQVDAITQKVTELGGGQNEQGPGISGMGG